MWYLKQAIRFLLHLFAPVITVGIGGVMAGAGVVYDIQILAWAGLAVIGAGIIWGILIYGGNDLF